MASVAVITKLVESIETVGVPEIAPVDVFIVTPAGSAGAMLKTIFGVPPEEVTGVKAVMATEVVNVVEAAARVVVRADETANVKVLELVAPFASVAVTTKFAAELDAAGVPEIAPVEELIASPDGSDGEIAKVTGDVPPEAVTGVKLVATALAVKVSDDLASVVVSAVETASEKVFALVAPLSSVAVTV